jgi:hypothetical protein
MAHIWIPGQPDYSHIVDDYSDAQFEKKPHGIVFVDGKEVAHTLKCPHCGNQFVSRKGSGVHRTFCFRHNAVTCGSPQCSKDCIDIYTLEGTLSVREY